MAGEWFVLAGTALPAMLEFLPRVLYDTYRMVIKREGWELGVRTDHAVAAGRR